MKTDTPKECSCWENLDKRLEEKGFAISNKCTALQMRDLTPHVARLLPLERLDGKKLKASDPKAISMSHCPFCGTPYSKEVK